MEPVNIAIDGDGDKPPLSLRPPGPRDLAAIARMYNDPETARWSLVPQPFTDEHTHGFLTNAARDWRRASPRWLIHDATEPVGVVALRRHPRQTWEIVYHVAPWARRRHIALRAVRAAAEFAFTTLRAARLEWYAIVGNQLSRLIALRLGFQIEGIARAQAEQRGERVDQWIGALLPGELRKLDDPPPGYDLARRRALLFSGEQPSLDTPIEGLRLRPLRAEDIDRIIDTARDETTKRWTTVPRPYERSHAEFFVDTVGAGSWRQGTQATFALADENDAFCGAIDLRLNNPDPRVAEVGYMTSPWARGRGFMPAALLAIGDFGFDSLDLERIEWKAHVGNDGSRRAAVKAGFSIEGTARADLDVRGERVDSWYGAKVRADR